MARPELERWLAERNLWIQGGQAGFLNGGLLNRIYFYLDEIVFANQPANSVPLALGSSLEGAQLHSFGTLDASAPASSVLTGGGTDHDVESIIDRNAYRWEQRMFGRPALTLSQRIWDNAMEWLNLQPFKSDPRRKSLFLYLRLVDGKYELAGPEDRAPDHDEALDTSSTARGNGIPMRRLAN